MTNTSVDNPPRSRRKRAFSLEIVPDELRPIMRAFILRYGRPTSLTLPMVRSINGDVGDVDAAVCQLRILEISQQVDALLTEKTALWREIV